MKARIIFQLLVPAIILAGTSAHAGSVTWVTPPGSMNAGNPVDAQAVFTFSGNVLTIMLTNLEPNPSDVAQCVSALIFETATALGSQNSYTSSGLERTVNSGGTFTDNPTAVSTGWVLSNPSGSILALDVLVGPGHAGPAHTLIGEPGGPTYSAAGGSIAGNGPHNPFLHDTPTFTLNFTGFTSDTVITAVRFQFGTTDSVDHQIPGVPQMVPEPSSFVLIGMGLIGLGGWRLRTRLRTFAKAA